MSKIKIEDQQLNTKYTKIFPVVNRSQEPYNSIGRIIVQFEGDKNIYWGTGFLINKCTILTCLKNIIKHDKNNKSIIKPIKILFSTKINQQTVFLEVKSYVYNKNYESLQKQNNLNSIASLFLKQQYSSIINHSLKVNLNYKFSDNQKQEVLLINFTDNFDKTKSLEKLAGQDKFNTQYKIVGEIINPKTSEDQKVEEQQDAPLDNYLIKSNFAYSSSGYEGSPIILKIKNQKYQTRYQVIGMHVSSQIKDLYLISGKNQQKLLQSHTEYEKITNRIYEIQSSIMLNYQKNKKQLNKTQDVRKNFINNIVQLDGKTYKFQRSSTLILLHGFQTQAEIEQKQKIETNWSFFKLVQEITKSSELLKIEELQKKYQKYLKFQYFEQKKGEQEVDQNRIQGINSHDSLLDYNSLQDNFYNTSSESIPSEDKSSPQYFLCLFKIKLMSLKNSQLLFLNRECWSSIIYTFLGIDLLDQKSNQLFQIIVRLIKFNLNKLKQIKQVGKQQFYRKLEKQLFAQWNQCKGQLETLFKQNVNKKEQRDKQTQQKFNKQIYLETIKYLQQLSQIRSQFNRDQVFTRKIMFQIKQNSIDFQQRFKKLYMKHLQQANREKNQAKVSLVDNSLEQLSQLLQQLTFKSQTKAHIQNNRQIIRLKKINATENKNKGIEYDKENNHSEAYRYFSYALQQYQNVIQIKSERLKQQLSTIECYELAKIYYLISRIVQIQIISMKAQNDIYQLEKNSKKPTQSGGTPFHKHDSNQTHNNTNQQKESIRVLIQQNTKRKKKKLKQFTQYIQSAQKWLKLKNLQYSKLGILIKLQCTKLNSKQKQFTSFQDLVTLYRIIPFNKIQQRLSVMYYMWKYTVNNKQDSDISIKIKNLIQYTLLNHQYQRNQNDHKLIHYLLAIGKSYFQQFLNYKKLQSQIAQILKELANLGSYLGKRQKALKSNLQKSNKQKNELKIRLYKNFSQQKILSLSLRYYTISYSILQNCTLIDDNVYKSQIQSINCFMSQILKIKTIFWIKNIFQQNPINNIQQNENIQQNQPVSKQKIFPKKNIKSKQSLETINSEVKIETKINILSPNKTQQIFQNQNQYIYQYLNQQFKEFLSNVFVQKDYYYKRILKLAQFFKIHIRNEFIQLFFYYYALYLIRKDNPSDQEQINKILQKRAPFHQKQIKSSNKSTRNSQIKDQAQESKENIQEKLKNNILLSEFRDEQQKKQTLVRVSAQQKINEMVNQHLIQQPADLNLICQQQTQNILSINEQNILKASSLFDENFTQIMSKSLSNFNRKNKILNQEDIKMVYKILQTQIKIYQRECGNMTIQNIKHKCCTHKHLQSQIPQKSQNSKFGFSQQQLNKNTKLSQGMNFDNRSDLGSISAHPGQNCTTKSQANQRFKNRSPTKQSQKSLNLQTKKPPRQVNIPSNKKNSKKLPQNEISLTQQNRSHAQQQVEQQQSDLDDSDKQSMMQSFLKLDDDNYSTIQQPLEKGNQSSIKNKKNNRR